MILHNLKQIIENLDRRWYQSVGHMRTLMGVIKDRHGTFYARKKVPKNLEGAVAQVVGAEKPRVSWLKRSLGTKDQKQANVRAKPALMEFDRIIENARATMKPVPLKASLSDHEIKRMGAYHFASVLGALPVLVSGPLRKTSQDYRRGCLLSRRPGHYPPEVRFHIRDDVVEDYIQAADFLNAQKYDVVSLQHEFGIFGGEAGAHILALIDRLDMPVVTTFHTVLSDPTQAQYKVLCKIAELSSIVVVMAEKARELLHTVYDISVEKIEVVPHGIPDFPFIEPDLAKVKLGFTAKPVILTFGLLSPNKGIEVVIDAMPLILKSRPDAVYVVLGATHPNLVRQEGEAYRESLMARASALGVQNNVVFLDQFVDQATLLDFISMCDVYVTPYFNEAQMTSGTLAYSFGLGNARAAI